MKKLRNIISYVVLLYCITLLLTWGILTFFTSNIPDFDTPFGLRSAIIVLIMVGVYRMIYLAKYYGKLLYMQE